MNIGAKLKGIAQKEATKSSGKPGKSTQVMGDAPKAGLNSSILEKVGHELKKNPPKILAKTRAKSGETAARKQQVAIMFSKARALKKKV